MQLRNALEEGDFNRNPLVRVFTNFGSNNFPVDGAFYRILLFILRAIKEICPRLNFRLHSKAVM